MIYDIAKDALAVMGIAGIITLIGVIALIASGHGTQRPDGDKNHQTTVIHLGNPSDPDDRSPHTLRITIMRSYYITEHVNVNTDCRESIHDGSAWIEFPIIDISSPVDGHLIIDEENIGKKQA
jgi:hypothetical protein